MDEGASLELDLDLEKCLFQIVFQKNAICTFKNFLNYFFGILLALQARNAISVSK